MEKPELDFDTIDMAALQPLIASRALSARDLVEHCLQRIDALDGRVNAVIELNPDAMEIAEGLDRDLPETGLKGPLHGLPVLIKDNIDTGDRMTTTAGSLALAGSSAKSDAAVARRLRAAGAVILGKTNLSEWANYRSSRSTSGWSSRGGQTWNPYALDRTPGGSSSGSAVAVACGFAAAAVGTETDGSIVSPSSMNSIVGIKPTVGLVSRTGIVPISHSLDTSGPMARSVADAALVLGAMAGSDPEDPATVDADVRRSADYTAFLDIEGLDGARIGVPPDLAGFGMGIERIFDDAVAAMRDAGATIVDIPDMPSRSDVGPHASIVLQTEFKAGLNVYLGRRGPDIRVHSLEELIVFNKANKDKVMPYFPQDLFEKSALRGGLDDLDYLEARKTCLRLTREEGIDRALSEHRLDALAGPTIDAPWLIDWVSGDNRCGSTSYLAAISGYPSITVPAGYRVGLPVGISFIASAWQEPTLIRLAYAFEQATKVRTPPTFRETVAF